MRYFKIPLCRNFVRNDKTGKKVFKRRTKSIGQKMGYDSLKHNLISISQLCDNGFEVGFKSNSCEIKQSSSNKVLFNGSRIKNVYVLYLDKLPPESCFVSLEKDKWIWHKRAGHVSMKTMSKLSKLDLVRG